MKTFAVVALFSLLLVGCCYAGSSSMSCSMVDGQWKCVQSDDPNGNMAGASSFSNGQSGQMAAGSGVPGRFNVNRGYNNGY